MASVEVLRDRVCEGSVLVALRTRLLFCAHRPESMGWAAREEVASSAKRERVTTHSPAD